MTKPDQQTGDRAVKLRSLRRAVMLLPLVLAVCILSGATGEAWADQRGVFPADMPKSYRIECDGCHVPFPPDLLPAESWREIMSGLGRHYGVDASIDTLEHEEIESFLLRYAGQGLHPKRNGDRLRLTDTLWFHRRHGPVKKLFQFPLVGSKANCGACHVRAEDGRYDEYTPLILKYAGRDR
jgi:hypothetical protein